MTANPYAIPVEELESRVRVPADVQVEVQAEPYPAVVDNPALHPFLDGGGGDVDGD
jgi:hypothetical protein